MKLFENKHVKRSIVALEVILMIVFMAIAYRVKIIPMKYMITTGIVFIIITAIEVFMIFKDQDKKTRSLVTQIICLLLSVMIAFGSSVIYKFGQTVDLMTENGFQQRAISVVVLKDSLIRNDHQIPDKNIGYMASLDLESMEYAVQEIEKNIGHINEKEYKDIKSLIDSLYNKQIDAIILDEAFRKIVENDKETFSDDTRVVYQITKDEAAISATSVDVTQKPFLVFVSGNDEYGKISAVSRTDVNMLVGVNPTTHQVLLISIPRDTYVPLHTSKQFDKFTHSGIYGLQESIATLEDVIKKPINYYGRMNFTSFIEVVDALGGIEVYSPIDFVTVKGHYQIKEGYNKLNAKQALSFVRERKAFPDGDFARGRNQQRMISAIVNKVCSPAILTSFSSVLDAVSHSVETNMTASEINALVQMQLSDMPKWDIQSCQIQGQPSSKACYSTGEKPYSVVEPYETSIQEIQKYVEQLLADEVIQTKAGDLNHE